MPCNYSSQAEVECVYVSLRSHSFVDVRYADKWLKKTKKEKEEEEEEKQQK